MSDNVNIPAPHPVIKYGKKYAPWAGAALVGLVALLGVKPYVTTAVFGDPTVNVDGKKETASFKVLSVSENKKFKFLNSTADWKDSANTAVAIPLGMAGDISGKVGKKVHVFVPLTDYENNGYKSKQYKVATPDDYRIE